MNDEVRWGEDGRAQRKGPEGWWMTRRRRRRRPAGLHGLLQTCGLLGLYGWVVMFWFLKGGSGFVRLNLGRGEVVGRRRVELGLALALAAVYGRWTSASPGKSKVERRSMQEPHRRSNRLIKKNKMSPEKENEPMNSIRCRTDTRTRKMGNNGDIDIARPLEGFDSY